MKVLVKEDIITKDNETLSYIKTFEKIASVVHTETTKKNIHKFQFKNTRL